MLHVRNTAPDASDGPFGAATPQHEAEDLTDGGRLAQIRLHDQVYTLRITRAGKLILTK